jgi:hypothetical protein
MCVRCVAACMAASAVVAASSPGMSMRCKTTAAAAARCTGTHSKQTAANSAA